MPIAIVRQQLHGYRQGHQLLASTVDLAREDQDAIDRLSDISGSLGPGQQFEPYLTAYPLPTGKYYVLARTWQDFNAPRAGCVLTRSLLIPMRDWIHAERVCDYIAMLVPFSRDTKIVELVAAGEIPVPSSTFLEHQVEELMEVLFLGPRVPVVAFGFDTDAEYITTCILSALWPAMRSQYSVSTFSLGAQAVSGRYFDLSFAPTTARQRFGNYECRRVDALGRQTGVSVWGAKLVQNLFCVKPPILVDPKVLSMLGDPVEIGNSDIRIALLWIDLLEQSETKASATLGLLDILNSRNRLGEEFALVNGPILRAIQLSERGGSTRELLHFIDTLSTKLVNVRTPLSITKRAWTSARHATVNNQLDAVRYIMERAPSMHFGSKLVTAAIGDEIDPGLVVMDEADITGHHSTMIALQLSSFSRKFAMRMVDLIGGAIQTSQLVERAFENLETLAEVDRKRVIRHTLPYICLPRHANVFGVLMRYAGPDLILATVNILWRTTELSVAEFDAPLLNAARDKVAHDSLRSAIVALPEADGSDRLLARSLLISEEDVQWVCQTASLSIFRSAKLLSSLIDRVSDNQLAQLFGSVDLAQVVIRRLESILDDAPTQLARLILVGPHRFDIDLFLVIKLLDRIEFAQRTSLARAFIRRGLASASLNQSAALGKLIESGLVAMEEIVYYVTDVDTTRRNVSDNLVLLNGLSTAARNLVLANLNELSTYLSKLPARSIHEDGISIWSVMIQDSWRLNKRSVVPTAWIAFEYALRQTSAATGPLAVASFPIVYKFLKAGGQAPANSSIGSIFEWDLSKAICKQLVRAFMESRWPPIGLLVAAYSADAVEPVLRQLLRRWKGDEYFKLCKYAVLSCEEPLRSQIYDALSRFDNFAE